MKKIFIFILVGFASIILFELFLTFSPFANGVTPMTYDKEIGMWHKKNFTNYIINNCYKTKYFFDAEGRIKNDYEYNNNKKNIILLGDSNIEALMVDNKNIIHNSLYDEIYGKYNVLNYGLSGTGPTQHLEILKNKIELNKVAKLIHFVFLENDLADGNPNNFDGTNRPKVHLEFENLNNYVTIKPKEYDLKERSRDFLGNFELYVYLKKTYHYYNKKIRGLNKIKSRNKHTSFNYNKATSMEKYNWLQLKGSIYQINKISLKNNFHYDIIFLSESENNGLMDNSQKLKKFLIDQNINNINIFQFLNKLKLTHDLGFECDSHWNDNTHKEIAKYIKKELKL